MTPIVSVTSRFLSLPAVLLLAACTYPPIDFSTPEQEVISLNAGESTNVNFFTSMSNLDTGVQLREGRRYRLDIVTLSHWIDGDITQNEAGEPLDQRGFANSRMPWSFLGTMRRSTSHRWFELMLYQPDCRDQSLRGVSELEFDESSGSYFFVAPCDGGLTLFVNDSFGFYANNIGYANIALSRIN